VTDVCLKRKIRNYCEVAKGAESGFAIYVQEGAILNDKHREAYKAVRPDDPKVTKGDSKLSPQSDVEAEKLRAFMCANFFDVRTFGAVMSTGVNCGQVRGPVQVSFARSVEPILPLEISITRMAATNEAEKKKREEGADDDTRTENRTMGRKHIVPYGLYRAHGFVSAKLAERTGFSDGDITFLWDALKGMFEHDHSAARGEMSARRLVAFEHDCALGRAPAHELFERVIVERVSDGAAYPIGDKRLDNAPPARRFSDYRVSVNREATPQGVTVHELL
ncbi:MAG TPA: type I-C CRISPR-associated protein Cas7/Csd2, partial [Methylocystis sp.]|nr:type I-C CRISPR-associated protein Cas7/Csd2 [Methylocystis sp.]